MSYVNTVYTTIDRGSTHIALGKNYLGSVNSYNNWVTRLFAWILNRSMTVDFEGKARSVNKKSYLELAKGLLNKPELTIQEIAQHKVFKTFSDGITLPSDPKMMRKAISVEKSHKLFRKLAIAISKTETDKALKQIGKGAALDTKYYVRTGHGLSFDSDTSGLGSDWIGTLPVFEGTPILVAANEGKTSVVNRLREFGADINVTAHHYTFTREIVGLHVRKSSQADIIAVRGPGVGEIRVVYIPAGKGLLFQETRDLRNTLACPRLVQRGNDLILQ